MQKITKQYHGQFHRKGATTVEFAVVLPILLVLVFGSMEFARLNQVSNAAAFAAFQGCRQAIISGGNATSATTAAQNVLSSMSIQGSTITITPATITPQTVAVTVVVAVKMDSACWIVPQFTAGQTISRGCTMTCQDVTPAVVPLPRIIPVYQPAPPPPTTNASASTTGTGSPTGSQSSSGSGWTSGSSSPSGSGWTSGSSSPSGGGWTPSSPSPSGSGSTSGSPSTTGSGSTSTSNSGSTSPPSFSQ